MEDKMKSILLTCLVAICCGRVFTIEQDYTVDNELLEPFPGEEETLVDFTEFKIVGRERFLNGSGTFYDDMDDDTYKFSVELYSSPAGDGNYKRMVFDVPQTSLCEGFKKFYVQFVQPSLIKDTNTDFPYIPDDGLCPFPAGTYYVKDIIFNTEDWPNQVPRGAVKAIVTFFKNGVNVGGFEIVVKVEDK